MDGALSNNMPLFEQRNTITMAPFSGESDICPREGTFNFFEVHYGNVSIQVNTGNVHRICTSFLPTKPEKLAEICHNGYLDAHRFLRERDMLGTQHLPPALVLGKATAKPCCELLESAKAKESKKTLLNERNPHQEDHRWLDLKNLPVSFKKVLCEACRDSHDDSDFLPVKVVMYVVTLLMLPIDLTISLISSVILSGCKAVYRLLMLTTVSAGRRGAVDVKTPTVHFRNTAAAVLLTETSDTR
ncbi:patatin-like phospholipase domain-containing protein 2 [Larimichthys crocea]|nr:patatin-like phospholipase domain-containing protein 2 [Larimichthys crocea]